MTWREILEGLAALPVALKQLRALQQVGTVSVATIGPGDAVVLEVEGKLSHDGRESMTKGIRKLFPDVKVIILDSGVRMSIVQEARVH